MMNSYFPLLLAALLLPAAAQALPRGEAVPGGLAVIPLDSNSTTAPQARYLNRRVMVEREEGRWYAVVGISLNDSAGEKSLSVKEGAAEQQFPFQVGEKEYEKQYITLKNKRMVNPNQNDLKRINSELKRSKRAYTNWRELSDVDTTFQLPLTGRISGTFGKRRYFNNQPRRPHSGVDIAAPEGTAVHAPSDGVISEVGDFFFNGKTVFIDHGQGLITMFCHLSSIDVAVGQEVRKGEVVAKVGMTGRATGPHLHWTVSLNNSRINPFLFVSESLLARLDHNERE